MSFGVHHDVVVRKSVQYNNWCIYCTIVHVGRVRNKIESTIHTMRAESIESRRLDAGNLGRSRADNHAMLPSSFKFDQDNNSPDDRLVDEDDEDNEDDEDDEDDDDDHYFRLSARAVKYAMMLVVGSHCFPYPSALYSNF